MEEEYSYEKYRVLIPKYMSKNEKVKSLKTLEPSLPPIDQVVFFDIETQGIDPFVDKVVTVQVRHRGKTTIWKEWELGEAKCIEAFFDFLETIYRKETSFVGYNLLKFDVSFIDERLRQLGIMNKDKWQMLHNYLHWVDLYQLLGNAYYKAKLWYGGMAGAKQQTENSEVPALYAKKDFGTIVNYIEEEMECMQTVYEGISKEPFYTELVKKRRDIAGITAS